LTRFSIDTDRLVPAETHDILPRVAIYRNLISRRAKARKLNLRNTNFSFKHAGVL
jgi:hypothetical protein